MTDSRTARTVALHTLPTPPARDAAQSDAFKTHEAISVFDVFKIGVGPSSSHTMGPWRAAQKFLAVLCERNVFDRVSRVRVELFGSLAKTGKGHATDVAVLLGLSGEDPVTCETNGLTDRANAVVQTRRLSLAGSRPIAFSAETDLVFNMRESLPFHANGLTFTAYANDEPPIQETYYSVGGGFVVQENEQARGTRAVVLPHPIERGDDLQGYCTQLDESIPQIVLRNERAWRPDHEIAQGLLHIWRVMQECIHRGTQTDGTLPGGLNVTRRAAPINRKLMADMHKPAHYTDHQRPEGWLADVRHCTSDFNLVSKWVSVFALAVNEENASLGRVVTAPTNGAAGVIPAVMMYAWCFLPLDDYQHGVLRTALEHDPAQSPSGRARAEEQRRAQHINSSAAILDFMLVAGEIGSLFKKGATISAAMGGCQAEIGVSSAMAAAGLTQILGGTVGQVLMAAEIAMEHHLGMTCDPIAGLVQIPCIERNTMGAMKAITAANIALESNSAKARVTLDNVIKTMWDTAQDMQSKYKETAEGGLAVHVPVNISEC